MTGASPGDGPSGAEALVRMLELHGVEVLFGLCGDTSLPFYDALARTGRAIRHVLTRDERHAAYMADGYARFSGRVGVCEGPSGGGLLYLLPGLAEANESASAVVGITTDISVGARGRFTLTALDQAGLARPVTRFARVPDTAATLPGALRAAFRCACGPVPGAAHVGVPLDVQRAPVDGGEIRVDDGAGRFPLHREAPGEDEVERAARVLAGARFPLLVCGGGVLVSGAEAALEAVAGRLGAAVATTVGGQGAIAEDHPLALGVIGSNGGTPPTAGVVDRADVVAFVGCRAGSVTTERWRRPAPGAARIVHVDADPGVIGVNYDTEAGVVGDARLALQALASALPEDPPEARRSRVGETLATARRAKWAAFAAPAASDESPVRPERLVRALRAALPDDAMVVADPGTPCPYLSAYFQWRRAGRQFLSNRAHGALGYSLAAAMGAHLARPDAPCLAVMGDGSFAMCAGELETLARLALPVTLVVVSNASFGWIKAGQRAACDGRYYSVDFGRTDHAAVARAFGLAAWTVADPAALDGVLAAALRHDGPALVDVISQPLEQAAAPVSEWIA